MKKMTFIKYLAIAGCVASLQPVVFSSELPELLIRHREAIGTVEAIEAVKSLAIDVDLSMLVLEGKVQSIVVAPDKSWSHVQAPVLEFTEASNGLIQWKKDQNQQITSKDDPSKLNHYAPVLPEFQYLFPNPEISVWDEGSLTVDGTEYKLLKIEAPGYKKPRVLYLDPETMLNVREETEEEGISMIVTHSDFREIEGLTLPFKTVQQALIPGMPPTTLTVTNIRVNEPVDMVLFEPPMETLHDFVFKETDHVTVPMTIQGEHLVLNVSINQHEPVLFILDSGAATTVIDASYADELGLERMGGMHVIGVGGAEEIDSIQVDSLAVGDFSIGSLNLFCMDLSTISKMLGLEDQLKGIVGYDLFARTVLTLDYVGKTLTITHPDHFDYQGSGSVIPGEITHNLLYVDGIVDGDIHGKLRLDTGAGGGLHLHAGHLKKLGVMDRYEGKHDVAVHGAGGEIRLQFVDVGTLKIGDYIVEKPLSTLNTGEGSSVLDTMDAMATVGNQVFSQFIVTFDFPNSRLILEPAETALFVLNEIGLTVIEDKNGDFIVSSVWEGSPAKKAGLLEGDRIIQIEKLRSGKDMSIDTVKRLLDDREKGRLKIKIKREGKVRKFKLKW
ncbi:MAG: aspartyl protease family protein [bacterium]